VHEETKGVVKLKGQNWDADNDDDTVSTILIVSKPKICFLANLKVLNPLPWFSNAGYCFCCLEVAPFWKDTACYRLDLLL